MHPFAFFFTLTVTVIGFTQTCPLNTPSHTHNAEQLPLQTHNAKKATPPIHCIDENNHPVDWVILIKLPRTHGSPNPLIVNGEAYLTVSSEDIKRYEQRKDLNKERAEQIGQRKTRNNINEEKKNHHKTVDHVKNIEKTVPNNIHSYHEDIGKKNNEVESIVKTVDGENSGYRKQKNVQNTHRNGHVEIVNGKNKGHKNNKHVHSIHGEHKLNVPLIPDPLITKPIKEEQRNDPVKNAKKVVHKNKLDRIDSLQSDTHKMTWFETFLFNALKHKVNDNSLEAKDVEQLLNDEIDEDKTEKRKVKRDVNGVKRELEKLIADKLELWTTDNGNDQSYPITELDLLMNSGQKQLSQHSRGTLNNEKNGLEDEYDTIENFKSLVDHMSRLPNEFVTRDNGMIDNWADGMDTIRALELLNNMEGIDTHINTFINRESRPTLRDHWEIGTHKDIHRNEDFTNNEMLVDSFVNLDGKVGGPDDLDRFKYSIGVSPFDETIDADKEEEIVNKHNLNEDKFADKIRGKSEEESNEDGYIKFDDDTLDQGFRPFVLPINPNTKAKHLDIVNAKTEVVNHEEKVDERVKDSVKNQTEDMSRIEEDFKEKFAKDPLQKDFKKEIPLAEDLKEEHFEDTLNWTLSKFSIRDPSSLPGRLLSPYLFNDSFSPLFTQDGVKILYNDQTPANKTTVSFGHSKGLLVGNSQGGIWIVHSIPHFVDDSLAEYTYPHTGLMYGQNFLCLTLNASTLDSVGANLGVNQIYKYSTFMSDSVRSLYPTLAKVIDGSFVPPQENFLAHDFSTSSYGEAFHSFAKTKELGQDLYKVIGDQLGVSLLVETWPNGPGRLRSDCRNPGEFVENVESIGADGVVSYRSTHDHAKWAISFGNETTNWKSTRFGGETKIVKSGKEHHDTETSKTRKVLGNRSQKRTENRQKDNEIEEALYAKANELDGSFESVFKRIEDLAARDDLNNANNAQAGDSWKGDHGDENNVDLNGKDSNLTTIQPMSDDLIEKNTKSGKHVAEKDINGFDLSEKRRTLNCKGETVTRDPHLVDSDDNGLNIDTTTDSKINVENYTNVAIDETSGFTDNIVQENDDGFKLTADLVSDALEEGNFELTADHETDSTNDLEEVDYWVCNGDINRAEDQLKRGGGSVCMNNKAVWTLYQGLINGVEPCPRQ